MQSLTALFWVIPVLMTACQLFSITFIEHTITAITASKHWQGRKQLSDLLNKGDSTKPPHIIDMLMS